ATGAAGLAQARELMKAGDLAGAGRAFTANLRQAPAGTHTIQLLVACSAETVQKASTAVGSPELFVVPVNFKGRDCQRLCWGMYESEAAAARAMPSVPDYFRKGGATPKAVTTASILP